MKDVPEGWIKDKLSNILLFEKKTKRKAGDGQPSGRYPFFTSSPIQSKFIDEFDFDGEYLIFGTGGSASVHYINGKFSATTDCYVTRVNGAAILPNFLYLYLSGHLYLLQEGFQGAGLKHISKGYINKISVMYPKDVKIQEKIISILDKAKGTLALQEQANGLIDDFLESVFIDMFGDPIKNPKGWPLKSINDLCSEIYRYPTFYGFEYSELGVPVVRIGNIQQDGILDPDLKNYVFISSEISDKYPRTKLELEDIVMAVRGDGSTAKRIGTVKSSNLIDANISPNLLRFKANSEYITPSYLFNLMISNGGQALLRQKVTRTAKKTITAENIKKILIPVPSFELQKLFTKIVNDRENLTDYFENSMDEIENLSEALIQKAFKGELSA